MPEIEIPTVETLYSDQYIAVVDNPAAVDLPKDQAGDPSTQENPTGVENPTGGQGDQSQVNFPTFEQIFGYSKNTSTYFLDDSTTVAPLSPLPTASGKNQMEPLPEMPLTSVDDMVMSFHEYEFIDASKPATPPEIQKSTMSVVESVQ